MELNWSREFEFAAEIIKRQVPTAGGVYEILQSTEYPRYQGVTRILKVGMSGSNLQKELLNHLGRHTHSNRLARIRNQRGLSITFKFDALDPSEAGIAEKQLPRDFEDRHSELPILNAQRGYGRTQDRRYRQ